MIPHLLRYQPVRILGYSEQASALHLRHPVIATIERHENLSYCF